MQCYRITTTSLMQGITLRLQPGSKVALVGPSGGGKVIYFVLLNACFFLTDYDKKSESYYTSKACLT